MQLLFAVSNFKGHIYLPSRDARQHVDVPAHQYLVVIIILLLSIQDYTQDSWVGTYPSLNFRDFILILTAQLQSVMTAHLHLCSVFTHKVNTVWDTHVVAGDWACGTIEVNMKHISLRYI